MVTGYQIVEEEHKWDLEDRVQRLINDGWQPIGNVCLSRCIGFNVKYAQAMTFTPIREDSHD